MICFAFAFLVLSYGRICSCDSVPMVDVMKDGFVKEGYGPLELTMPIPTTWSGTDIGICFWLHPYRYLNSNSILSVSPSAIESAMISFMLIEGNLVGKLSNCILSLDIKPDIREWTHLCFSLSANTEVFLNGTLYYTQSCKTNQIFMQEATSAHVKVGGDQQVNTPLSGKSADIRIYWRGISADEAKNISKVLDIPSDYVGVLSLADTTNEHESSETFVEISSVKKDVLLTSYMKYILIFIAERGTYENAESVCETRQGLLPDMEKHGTKTIIDLIFQFTMHSGISISSFWVRSKNKETCYTGNYVSRPASIELLSISCNNTNIKYFCVVEKKISFQMIGFADSKIEVFPVPYEVGVFESIQNYKLYLKNGHFFVKDVTFDHIFYYALISKTTELIGRHKWYRAEDNSYAREITISGCSDNEFTCTNGKCVKISLACDLHGDCMDKSDEGYCEVGLNPSEFYDRRLPPSSFTMKTTKLELNFEIPRIISASTEDNTVELSVVIKIKWIDPRLQFQFLHINRSMIISPSYASRYWQPDLLVLGAISGEEKKLSFMENPGKMTATPFEKGFIKVIESYEASVQSGENVVLENEKLESVSLMCEMELFFFPFDDQECSFSLLLINEFVSDIEWDKDKTSIKLPSMTLALYSILDFKFEHVSPKEIRLMLQIARKFGAYIFNTFLPCVVLEVIGLMTHLLPINDYNDRVTVTLSCLIVMAALFTQVSSTLPKSAEPKFIDIWMFVHIVVLLFVFMVHVTVIFLHNIQQRSSKGSNELEEVNKKTLFKDSQKHQYVRNRIYDHEIFPPNFKYGWKESEARGCSTEYFLAICPKKANRVGFIVGTFGYCTFLLFFYLLAGKVIFLEM